MLGPVDPTSSPGALAALLKNDERDLVRSLAIGCMLGGIYAEYICGKAGADKTQVASSADPDRIFAAIQYLFHEVVHAQKAVISGRHCEAVDLWEGRDVRYLKVYQKPLKHSTL